MLPTDKIREFLCELRARAHDHPVSYVPLLCALGSSLLQALSISYSNGATIVPNELVKYARLHGVCTHCDPRVKRDPHGHPVSVIIELETSQYPVDVVVLEMRATNKPHRTENDESSNSSAMDCAYGISSLSIKLEDDEDPLLQ